ncbi:TonB-dependent receptor plug domain-containing protein [Riemerella anatipestifer]|uniref:TonB-dependent receptor plug domain-containing protein n=1 Tax=Riemerella anatipestifer TaxID=34085 RepID=UPI0030EEB5EE
MKYHKLSLAVLFLCSSTTFVLGQEVKKDSIKNEKKIDGVQLKATINKKTETAVLQAVKKSSVQVQAMGSEEISRKGISNVEQSLTKITGVNTVEGKGLFVRGLEERYNTLLINGLGSPSNNPFQKIIALKQFPTDVVGKLNIYKTFNSNLYADFAGATFDIETLSYDKPFTKVEFSIGFNSQTTFRDRFKISENANTIDGYLGLNYRNRQLPSEVKGFRPSNYIFNGQESVSSFKDSWNVDNIKALPNTGLSFTTAQRFKAGSGRIGLLLSLNQANKYQYQEGHNNLFLFSGSNITYNNKLYQKEYEYETESSALLGLGYKNKGTDVMLNAIFLQNSTNIIQDNIGYVDQGNSGEGLFRVNQQDISRFTDIQLIASQKLGKRHLIKAGGSWVNNLYQQPDRKIFSGNPETPNDYDRIRLSYGGNNLIRQYLDVSGKNYLSAFAEYKLSLGEKNDRKSYPIELSLGYNGFMDRRSTSYRFIYSVFNNSASPNGRTVIINPDTPQDTFNQSALNGFFNYREGSNVVYRNNIYQFVNAGYASIDYKPNDTWDIILGGRIENNMNITRYKELSNSINGPFLNLTRNQYYFLPSLSVKKELNSKTNLRFAFSKTITRPILIEYMPITYINPNNENILGNPRLTNSENYNFDFKYELFPTKDEIFAFGIFGKKIINAIEKSYTASANSNGQTITFFNASEANLAGIELEGIINLRRISENLSPFSLGVNTTLMYSDVKRSSLQKEQESDRQKGLKRGLQGAAPWTVNADLKYERKNVQNLTQTASLVYNVSGSKIHTLGSIGIDHIYERPFHKLDFVYQRELSKQWKAKFSVINLLNSKYKLEYGNNNDVEVKAENFIHTDYRRGTNFNFSIEYTF